MTVVVKFKVDFFLVKSTPTAGNIFIISAKSSIYLLGNMNKKTSSTEGIML